MSATGTTLKGNADMKEIIRDYRRAYRKMILGYWISTLVVIGAFFLSGVILHGKMMVPAILAAAFLFGLSCFLSFNILIKEPGRFKQYFNGLPDNVRERVIAQYPKASRLGQSRFMEEYLIFYNERRIVLLVFKEIMSVDDRGRTLAIKNLDGTETFMPVRAGEMSAVIMAVLRSKNPRIKFMIGGKKVNLNKK